MKRKARNERYTAPLGNPRHYTPFITFRKKSPAKPLAEEPEATAPEPKAPEPKAKAEGPRPIPKSPADADALEFGSLVRFFKAVLKT